MPTLHIYAFERPVEKKREMVKRVTEVMCETFGCDSEAVNILIVDMPRHNVAHAGTLYSD